MRYKSKDETKNDKNEKDQNEDIREILKKEAQQPNNTIGNDYKIRGKYEVIRNETRPNDQTIEKQINTRPSMTKKGKEKTGTK